MKVEKYKKLLVPEGTYDAVITEMHEESGKFKNPAAVVRFEIQDFEFEENPNFKPSVTKYYTLTLSTQGHLLQKFVKPLLNRGLKSTDYKDDELDLDQFLNWKCRITVVHEENEDGELWAKVTKVEKNGQE